MSDFNMTFSGMAVLIKFTLLASIVLMVTTEHEDDSHHVHHNNSPKPYKFGYEISDPYSKQHRYESQDGHGNVKGSYGYVDSHGMHRVVHYTADDHGFRAKIKTNEKGTDNQNPAYVLVDSAYHHHDDDDH